MMILSRTTAGISRLPMLTDGPFYETPLDRTDLENSVERCESLRTAAAA